MFILKVMTANPKCVTLDTAILEALHIMHDGKFLHLPVLGRGNKPFVVLDVKPFCFCYLKHVRNR